MARVRKSQVTRSAHKRLTVIRIVVVRHKWIRIDINIRKIIRRDACEYRKVGEVSHVSGDIILIRIHNATIQLHP